MAESFITQCPHCGTSFRVRTEQLSVANGSVRCGACLQVFSARNHVVTTSVPAQAGNTKPKAAAAEQAKKAAQAKQAAAAKQKAAQPKTPPARPETAPPRPQPPKDDFSFPSDEDDDAEFLFTDGKDDDEFIFDDNASDSLFDDDEKDDSLGEFSDSFLNLNGSSSDRRDINHFQKETQEMKDDYIDDPEQDDESWAESMLEEIEKEETVSMRKPANFESPPSRPRQPQDKPAQRTQSIPQQQFSTDFGDDEDFSFNQNSPSHVVNSASREIELDFHMDERLHRLRPLGWLVILLLLALLAGQLAWMFRDNYARMDQWRGLYQTACNVIGCTLPEQVDLSAVRTSVLVREHKDPQLSDIRMVDVVLTNRAAFKQPFPVLVMQYTDVNGKLVADQAFQPDSYLKGELTGVKLMPINTRVYVSFPIQTPPDNAVNYQILLQRNPND